MGSNQAYRAVVLALLLSQMGCGSTTSVVNGLEDATGSETEGTDRLGVVWTEVPGNPVFAQPVCPTWNCLGMTDPWIGNGPGGDIFMWVSGGGDSGEHLDGNGVLKNGPVVGRARANDDLAFEFDPNAALLTPPSLPDDPEPVWDRWRETVSALYEADSGWTLWYLGYSVSVFDDPGIGQVSSMDGLTWTRPTKPIYRPEPDGWDHAFISGPTVVVGPDGVWRLYYSGAGTTVGVGLLLSHDQGSSWQPHEGNPVFERDLAGWDEGILEVTVRYVEGRYMMWYSGYEEPLDLQTTPISIGLAVSGDGIHWQRYTNNPVIRPGPSGGGWNGLRVSSPSVHLLADGSLLMAVHGQNHADAQGGSMGRIGLYRSEGAGLNDVGLLTNRIR